MSSRGGRGGAPHPGRAGGAGAGLLALVLGLALAGCATRQPMPTRPDPSTLPAESPLLSRTLREQDAWLRHYLLTGEHARAVEAMKPDSRLVPRDRLVRALQEGVILHEAGDFQKSNQVLEWAEVEADLRITRSLSRAAASLLVNDGVMSYTPSSGELIMVPYYRMLNYLALGQQGEALVEARKANALLARLPRQAGRCREDGMLQYLAGLVQEAGGETGDALVSLRLASQWLGACGPGTAEMERRVAADVRRVAVAAGIPEIADSVTARYTLQAPDPAPAGEFLLMLEHGFVAHRAEQALHVPVFPEDIEGLEEDDDDAVAAAAARITHRLLVDARDRQLWGRSWNDAPLVQWANALEGAYVLRLAWPAMRLEASRPAATRVWVGDSLVSVTGTGDLSAVVQEELEDRRAAMLTRLVARGVVKYLVSREMEKKSEKKGGELASFLVGRIANLAANQLEQADLRSWSLLPDRIAMVRARLPEGTHAVRVETLGARGEVVSTRDLGMVTIRAGELAVMRERVWGAEAGELREPRPLDPPLLPEDALAPRRIATEADPPAARTEERTESVSRPATPVRTRSCPDNTAQGECAAAPRAEPRAAPREGRPTPVAEQPGRRRPQPAAPAPQ